MGTTVRHHTLHPIAQVTVPAHLVLSVNPDDPKQVAV